MIGSVARVPNTVQSGRLTQDTVKLVFRERDTAFEHYLYWLLRTSDYRNYCAGRATGSAVAALSREDFLAYPVPPLTPTRRRVIDVLEKIEDKIESNHRFMILTSNLADALASQLMEVNDTHVVALSTVVKFNTVTIRPSAPDDQLVYVDIASVSSGSIDEVTNTTWAEAPSRARRGVSEGDVIYSTVRPGRRSFAQVLDPDARTVVSTGFAVMSPLPTIGSSLLTTVAASPEFATYLESVAHGSAYPAVSIEAMGNYRVKLPTDTAVVAEFEAMAMPLRRKAHQADHENQRLAQLRDTLLPELISGRIRVPEAA